MLRRARRIVLAGSLPLAAPWNGADKTLARALVRHDLANRYVLRTGPADPWRDGVRAVRCAQPAELPTRREKLASAAFLFRHAHEGDLVHLVASVDRPPEGLAALVRGWRRLTGMPVVHTIPSLGPDPGRLAGGLGDVAVVFSRHSERLARDAGAPEVIRLHPPVDTATLLPSEPAPAVRRRWRLGERAVLYAGHYGAGSGIREAIHALARLPEDLGDAVLVLACRRQPGDDVAAEQAGILAWAQACGVAERVRLLEHVPDMPALISACAATVLVPRRLGAKLDLPLVLLESLALERPIVVSDAGPLPEAVLGGGGLVTRTGDAASLSAALTRLLRDGELCDRLGRRGRRAVARLCDPGVLAARYDDIYASLEAPSRWR